MNTYRQTEASARATLLFTISDKVGALDNVLRIISANNVSLCRIESRPSKTSSYDYDFFVDFDPSSLAGCTGDQSDNDPTALADNDPTALADNDPTALADNPTVSPLSALLDDLRPVVASIQLIHQAVPWFPRKMADLDSFAAKTLDYGDALDADHPGFTDDHYRNRRAEITAIARTHRHGSPIPAIQYTQQEIDTWAIVFNKLTALYPTHACRQHRYVFPLLIQNCGYSDKNIPQLEDISRFLKECTGFTLRPVMGLLSSRDFLNGLAFRVFHSTQYIRHHSKPLYTPEPDVCHELLGHVPLFADPEFAEFSQEIGLASLGASDEDIEKLATIYWFTVEFGLCKEGDNVKAFGAGLLSSFGELEVKPPNIVFHICKYCLSDKPQKVPFDPAKAAVTKYPITEYQPLYFVAESFKRATDKVREFAATLTRSFSVRYNPYTETIEVLDSKEKVVRYATSIRGDMQTLVDAISKLP